MILALGMILDALLGEPKALWDRVPHPAVLMGRAVGALDAWLNRGPSRQAKGLVALILLVLGAAVPGWVLQAFGGLVEIVVVAILLAQRSLADHVRAVADGLRMSLAEGRRAVAQVVGRDTRDINQPAVARAAIESAAENFSDGVVAPAFWFLLAGLPGLLVYKIVNTADSMIGYRNDRYEEFGKAAARFDDLLNVIPARLTAAILALAHGHLSDWQAIRADARLHRSPNAGWPEAAMARALNVALAGPRSYDGRMQAFAFVNESGQRDIGPVQVEAAVAALWRGWVVVLAAVIGVGLILG